MLQNATLLRKSAPRHPNISDEHVSCTAPAMRNASLQILFNCSTLPTLLKLLQNSHVLLTFDKVHNPLRQPRRTTSERPKVLRDSGTVIFFLHFWLRNVLQPTTAYTFSTSQLPKVLRTWCALHILTSKCASHHNGAQPGVFCTFWLPNVLRATTACNLSSIIWPDGSAPAALASVLFDPPEPEIIRKTRLIATFVPFRAPASSFFRLFLFSSLIFFSSLLFSSRLISSRLVSSLLWLFPPLLFHLPTLSEVLLLNFLRYYRSIGIWREKNITGFTALYKTVRNNELFAGTFVLKGTSPCRDLAGRRWWWRRLEVLPTSSSDADVHPIPWSRKKRSPYGLPKSIDPRQASRYPMVGGRDSMESHWVGRFILNSNMYLFLSERNG